MITVRKSKDRGFADHGWLRSHHTFSFADYHDPKHMGFRALRVINEDYIQAGEGFGTHPHRDMEIITYVLQGALAHKDSMGNGSTITPGEVQYMSAGSGVTHSEFNASETEVSHILQIWILPQEREAKPRYDQKRFSEESKKGVWKLLVSPDGRDGSIAIRQDAQIYATILEKGQSLTHAIRAGRHAWLQVVAGGLTVEGQHVYAGDGIAVSEQSKVEVLADTAAEVLLFDLS